jgi:hypothetical protein
MEKTTFEDKKILWRKRRQNPNLDCHLQLFADGNYQKRTKNREKFV